MSTVRDSFSTLATFLGGIHLDYSTAVVRLLGVSDDRCLSIRKHVWLFFFFLAQDAIFFGVPIRLQAKDGYFSLILTSSANGQDIIKVTTRDCEVFRPLDVTKTQ